MFTTDEGVIKIHYDGCTHEPMRAVVKGKFPLVMRSYDLIRIRQLKRFILDDGLFWLTSGQKFWIVEEHRPPWTATVFKTRKARNWHRFKVRVRDSIRLIFTGTILFLDIWGLARRDWSEQPSFREIFFFDWLYKRVKGISDT